MSVIRGSALAGYSDLVDELGGDPRVLLRRAGIPLAHAGNHDVFIPYLAHVRAVETAAAATGARDFGRRLALRQGIEILGPVGVAARTSATVGEAIAIAGRYMEAYGPAIDFAIRPGGGSERVVLEFRILLDALPPHPHTIELALGTSLRVVRSLWETGKSPLLVHLPHAPLTPRSEYTRYFGCRARFAEPMAGFTIRARDLDAPVSRDTLAHHAVIGYLDSLVDTAGDRISRPVAELVRLLLPTGAASLDVVARQLMLHPKTLQRRLAAEGTTFATIVDDTRRSAAERYLRDTDLTLGHVARELGYAEQSVLVHASKRWFGRTPLAHRRALKLGV